ncbi:hypothetical protein OUZ56_031801 [Daphnia magna]|uniref:C2H2-type domain-containing protein n=1 Tax=Daphnia magna TaxID=35525 RepID=A0ABQ9ZV87_9CRUS|nr:hypothetical protein OUZ56_031801 [Daphnia magna]
MYVGPGGMWGQGGENYLLAMLQRSPAALQQIAKTFSESGVSEARFTLDGSTRSSLADHLTSTEMKFIRTHSTDVGVLCKACQTLYGSEVAVVQHQRAGCPQTAESSAASSGGATRLVLLQHECMACEEKCPTLAELRNHLNGEPHRRQAAKLTGNMVNGNATSTSSRSAEDQLPLLPPMQANSPSSGLSSQIEDVVKQLTALAQATTGPGSTVAPSFGGKNNSGDCDTNANIAQRKAATYGQ